MNSWLADTWYRMGALRAGDEQLAGRHVGQDGRAFSRRALLALGRPAFISTLPLLLPWTVDPAASPDWGR